MPNIKSRDESILPLLMKEKANQHDIKDNNDLIRSQDDYVVVTGPSGMGKSTLTETITYEWSIGRIWNGFKFLFHLSFNKLNTFKTYEDITADQILQNLYPDFREIQRNHHHKILLILDGFDEFCNKKEFLEEEHTFSSFTKAIWNLMNPDNIRLPFARLITSRPSSCSILFNRLQKQSSTQRLRIIEIVKFNESAFQNYIDKWKESDTYCSTVCSRIERVSTPMAPFFFWGYRHLCSRGYSITNTIFYSKLLLMFIRTHGLRNQSEILSILDDKEVQQMIKLLSEIAYKLEINKNIIITEDILQEAAKNNDIKIDDVDALMYKSGLTHKNVTDDGNVPTYNFFHSIFQEFLVALYIFRNNNYKESIDKIDNTFIWALVQGLEGGAVADSKSDQIVKRFANIFRSKETRPNLDLFELFSKGNGKIRKCSLLIKMLVEYQNKIDYTLKVGFDDGLNEKMRQYADYFSRLVKDQKINIKTLEISINGIEVTEVAASVFHGLCKCVGSLIVKVKSPANYDFIKKIVEENVENKKYISEIESSDTVVISSEDEIILIKYF